MFQNFRQKAMFSFEMCLGFILILTGIQHSNFAEASIGVYLAIDASKNMDNLNKPNAF